MSWNDAKKRLMNIFFPDQFRGQTHAVTESHMMGKTLHKLESFRIPMSTVEGFECEAYYNYCQECKQIRKKNIVVFNPEKNAVSIKHFVVHGKSVN